MANIQLSALQKKFGPVEVIRSIDLKIESGEFIVFVGPSGCGKSTLLRMIAGLEEVTSGTVSIDGIEVTRAEPSKRGIAMVFQTYALYPHMSVEENMAFGLEMAGMPKQQRLETVRKAAEMLQLVPYLERKPKALSGGQRQRVAIGRAIVRDPKIFLFDEPLSNLDAELRVQMRLEIAKLHSELGATMIYVTHDQVEAMTLAKRIVVLRDGRIEQFGTPDELYSDPDNMFVAGFIGSPKINLVPARVTGRTEQGAVSLDVPQLGLSGLEVMPRDAGAELPQDVILGIRPEHFSAEPGGHEVRLECSIIERLGGVSYVYTDPGRDHAVTMELRGATSVKAGDIVSASIDPGNCFLFTPDGTRL
ncbi:ATPase component of ABC-type sugar transporter [Hoeflea sp. IMCC20628]|uniref:ABC transporter ATP-binding protein n=1 Tax=Hoeflea sp. IMCC20628 TaxID=1620421 RepID=UPI00063AFDCE|nr:sn-glycerol-3-phosphate ABC transporter ATP-binding protein UgpC [Hoeflea sp. IMCC20628]AKI02657.1 ATPase component of ABC-type sugar transporter [Hoeflea sp. IMCC20628]